MNPMVFFITLVFATLVTAIPVFTNDIAMRCVGDCQVIREIPEYHVAEARCESDCDEIKRAPEPCPYDCDQIKRDQGLVDVVEERCDGACGEIKRDLESEKA
ncbi:MAG: hypothetical protein TREMPRED_000539 [Tremellales sp. Tagirdzhanova-0007]|nr:MAG: hypothetical protein TREMPRED_000539 [Tremellales sp. Tagirdzhanova-0007]